MYRSWLAIGIAGFLGGVAVVSLFVGFGSPVFFGVAAVSAVGGYLAYRYARERMLASVYAGVETDRGETVTGGSGPDGSTADGSTVEGTAEEADTGGGRRTTQATDGGATAADYDDWTWADSDPDDSFWSDDPEDWEDPWDWEATDPEEAGGSGWRWGERSGSDSGSPESGSWTGRTGGGRRDGPEEQRRDGTDGRGDRRRDRTAPGDREGPPTVEAAYETLGLEPGADLEAVREAYRERAKETHPDCGGDPETFIRVREAYERLRERLDGDEQ